MKKVIIAVDAGGTTTKAIAINSRKEIVYEKIGGPGSPAVLGIKAMDNIFKLIEQVYLEIKNEYEVGFVQVGMSGYGVIADISQYEKDFSEKLKLEVRINSDTDLGLYSIIEDKYSEGLLVLSGTGSAVAGIKDDKTMLAGGFGVLLTESGSAYAAVKTLIVNIIKGYEESLEYSKLGREFMELLDAKEINFFRNFMYTKTKTEIASYSNFISQKALTGNEEAILILQKAGRDLAGSAINIYRNLKLSENAILGFRGGFIRNAPYVSGSLLNALYEQGIAINVYEGSDDPIYGAYYLAKRKGKI